jgi:ech hydrogenase subunit A
MVVPPVLGLLAFLCANYKARRAVVTAGVAIQAALAIALAVVFGKVLPVHAEFRIAGLDYWCFGFDALIGLYVAFLGLRKKRAITFIIALIHIALATLDLRYTSTIEADRLLVIDQMSVIMVLIIGIVGGLIIFDATGYMRAYHEEHPEVKDRRRFVALIMLSFLGAMYGIVLTNDLRLTLVFWEATTLASYLLIGYAGDAESERNAFRALNLNMIGGISFTVAIILLAINARTVELDRLVEIAKDGGVAFVIASAALLALAGVVKSAQLPFTSWLLGAMVAPTPVSALLHSSTMVKAGVFLLLRLAPALTGTVVGYLIAFIGILTFIAGSFAAISRRNAKRVLALSTVSNLGLIVTCAGIGTYQLVWVGLFLIIFHAVAKALLFLAVGTASVGTGSLDIEDMGGLIMSMPRVAFLLIVGIAAMFVAPFGMLISKWAAMEAFINMNSIVSPLMIVLLAFGSSTTVFFWAKWLGVLIRMNNPNAQRGLLEGHITKAELIAEYTLAFIAIIVCATFPLISHFVVEPYLLGSFGMSFGIDRSNAIITVLMVVMIVAVPGLLIAITHRGKKTLSSAYMSGRPSTPDLAFAGSMGKTRNLETRSYYFEKLFREDRILSIGTWVGLLLVITTIGTVLL